MSFEVEPLGPRGPQGLGVTPNAYFLLTKHTIELSLVSFCDMTAGLEVAFRADSRGGQRDKQS